MREKFYIGVDDTDMLDISGTGQLSRGLLYDLLSRGPSRAELGLSRHQLLQDPRVPSTRMNRCSCIVIDSESDDREALIEESCRYVTAGSIDGSDPGVCLAAESQVDGPIEEWGHTVKRELVTQSQAGELAERHAIFLRPLGGTGDGIIGALASVGLRRGMNDGWMVVRGELREMHGRVEAGVVRLQGIDVRMQDGSEVPDEALLITNDKLRASIRNGMAVVHVRPNHDSVLEALLPEKK